jgi:hypothetical protein
LGYGRNRTAPSFIDSRPGWLFEHVRAAHVDRIPADGMIED